MGFFKRLLGLESYTFYVDASGGWAGAQIEDLLQQHGIEMSNRHPAIPPFTFDELFFDVALADVGRAREIMFDAGVPLLHEHDRRGGQQADRRPAAQSKPADELEAMDAEMEGWDRWAKS